MGKTLEECYKILGVDYGATEDEIKSAYRKKALQCHPDKNPDDPLSTQKFQELGHAYRRLTGDEDDDTDDDYEDYDMELWKKFFFFLFRDDIIQRVFYKCSRCGRTGEEEDDDFLASLVKEQDEEFTEEEMAQFTSFANLKEQRDANKKKFCDRNLSNGKPKQKGNQGNQARKYQVYIYVIFNSCKY
ncbi:dnaJ homolog subfamily C member 5B-like isoform X2 [Stylophora pistillata]|uniref:dnaJ homolog subfamily C member 5B-like isoform X2 n=1 Tax=Stylophora pistillata TaxID=50429 RepID=UPI000C05357F|nr:dnaJ homolog subfamily C member 5B-like isoform X2 [Stylophora pistillata]